MKLGISIFLLLLSHISFSQEAWKDVYQESARQYQQGNLREGYRLAKQALVSVRLEHGNDLGMYADNLRLLTLICYSSHQPHEGLQYAQQELKLREEQGAEDLPVYGEVLNNIGLLQMQLSRYDSAVFYLKEASSLLRLQSGNTVLQTDYQLARAYQSAGQLKQADSIFSQTIRLAEQDQSQSKLIYQAKYQQALIRHKTTEDQGFHALQELKHQMEAGKDTLSKVYINTLCQLAGLPNTMDTPEESINLYERAKKMIAIARPVDSLKYAFVIDNLGVLRLAQGDIKQAEYFISRALLIRSQYLDIHEGILWSTVDHMAEVLLQKEGASKAIEFYEGNIRAVSPSGLMPYQYAVVLNNLGLLYWKEEQYQQSDACYREAIASLMVLDRTDQEANTQVASIYYNVARSYQSQSKYDSAIYYYKNALSWSKVYAGKTSPEYRAGVNGIAGLYHDIGYYTESEIFYQEALQLEEAVNSSTSNEYANVLNNYALLLQAKGDYVQAEEKLNSVVSIKRELFAEGQKEAILPALSNLGLLYLNIADYQEARDLLREVLTSYQRILPDNDPQLIPHLVNMARMEIAEANYTRAEPLLKKASRIADASYGRNHPDFASIQLEMANLYLALGNYSRAENLLETSKAITTSLFGKIHPDYASAVQNLATLYEATDRDSLAEACFKEALEIDLKILGKYHPDYAVSLNNLASFYQNSDQHSKALPLLEESLAISRSTYGKEHPSYIATLLNLSLLYQENGQYQKAESMIEEALSLRKKVLGELHPDYAYALYSKAVLYHRMKRYKDAMPVFHQAVKSYIRQIKAYFPALSEKEKSAFYKRVEPVLNGYRNFVVDVVSNQKNATPTQCNEMIGNLYDIQLVTKAMLLNTSSKIRESIMRSNNPELLQVYHQWVKQKEMLAQVYTLSRKSLSEKGIDISQLEREANDLEKQLSSSSAQFTEGIGIGSISWQDIQKGLGQHEAAIEIVRGQRNQDDGAFYVALSVSPTQKNPRMTVFAQGENMEGKNYFYYKNAITFRVRDTLSYDLYWKEIAEVLPPDTEKVYVAPDGIYNKLSLLSLLNHRSNNYLIDELDINILSSTRSLAEKTQNVADIPLKKNKQAFLFGYPNYRFTIDDEEPLEGRPKKPLSLTASSESELNPFRYGIVQLPGTRKEVNDVDKMLQKYEWSTFKFTENAALEENLKQVKSPDLLHIATHGYFMKDLPANNKDQFYGIHLKTMAANPLLRSGLLLTGAEQTIILSDSDDNMVLGKDAEDGILTSYEAMNLDLYGTELVVLSACETGLGDVRNGEGVYGLQRAFLVAGAQSILMSLWKVNDQVTTQLIDKFYAEWLSGNSKEDALRKAQASIKEKYEDPYFWSAFVLMEK